MKLPFLSNVDPSKIKTIYGLLAVFLLVTNAGVVFWLSRAQTAWERTTSGVLFLALLAFFLITVIELFRSGARASPTAMAQVAPAAEVTTKDDISESQETDRRLGPDGSYTLQNPPDNWDVTIQSQAANFTQNLRISDPTILSKFQQGMGTSQNVLVLASRSILSVTPMPGQTRLDGVKFPSALEIHIPRRLSIYPLERNKPPLHIDYSAEHSILIEAGEVIRLGLFKLTDVNRSHQRDGKRVLWRFEFEQRIEDAIVGGIDHQSVHSHMTVFGVEGETKDYLLVMQYPLFPERVDAAVQADIEVLQEMANSFRPVRSFDGEQRRQEAQRKAERDFQETLESKGKEYLVREFGMFCARWSDANLDSPEQRSRVLQGLRPFAEFARLVGAEGWMDDMFQAARKAEAGDAKDFKEIWSQGMVHFREGVLEQDDDAPKVELFEKPLEKPSGKRRRSKAKKG